MRSKHEACLSASAQSDRDSPLALTGASWHALAADAAKRGALRLLCRASIE